MEGQSAVKVIGWQAAFSWMESNIQGSGGGEGMDNRKRVGVWGSNAADRVEGSSKELESNVEPEGEKQVFLNAG